MDPAQTLPRPHAAEGAYLQGEARMTLQWRGINALGDMILLLQHQHWAPHGLLARPSEQAD